MFHRNSSQSASAHIFMNHVFIYPAGIYMLWFNFYFPCFCDNEYKTKKNKKIEPRIEMNHSIYTCLLNGWTDPWWKRTFWLVPWAARILLYGRLRWTAHELFHWFVFLKKRSKEDSSRMLKTILFLSFWSKFTVQWTSAKVSWKKLRFLLTFWPLTRAFANTDALFTVRNLLKKNKSNT